jgi:hypothetical protein
MGRFNAAETENDFDGDGSSDIMVGDQTENGPDSNVLLYILPGTTRSPD